MKKARAILCGVLAALMLAGCGGQQGGATLDLKQYAVAQAVYPDYPKRPVEADYYRDDGQWDDSAYEADYEKYVDGLRALGKNEERVDTAALTAFGGNTAAAIFTTQENTVYSPVSLYVALSMLTELTDGETKRQVMDLLGVTDSGALREWTKTLWEQLYCDDGVNTLRLANASFLNERVQFKQPVKVGKLALKVAGSANMVVNDVTADKVELDIDGDGSITVKKGTANEGDYSIVTKGDIHAYGLEVSKINCKVTGNGLAEITPKQHLKAQIVGKGNIRYQGPTAVDQRVIGKGKVEEVVK